MAFQFNFKKAEDAGTAAKGNKPQGKKQIFNVEDDDDVQTFIPKGAKISKNIGPALNQNAGAMWNTADMKHPLHRPVDKYFSDKAEMAKKIEQEALKEKMKEKTLEDNKMMEWQKLKELIRNEKNKVRICLLCKRKFINANHLSKHEKSSKIHASNLQTFSKKIQKY